MKPLEHALPFQTLMTVAIGAIILGTILRARRGRELFIRRIPGLSAIDEAVGRATEMGRPVLFAIGLGGVDIVTLQALAVVSHVARMTARYGSRLLIPVCDPVIFPFAEEVSRQAYSAEGKEEAHRPEDVRFLSNLQFAYAAGVVGMMTRERPASNFFFGSFAAESLLLAETGHQTGAIQVAGTPDYLQTPFFLAACDYTLIGDEYYAASAYISREPTLLGSLVGQDVGKAILLGLVLAGFIWSVYTFPEPPLLASWLGGG